MDILPITSGTTERRVIFERTPKHLEKGRRQGFLRFYDALLRCSVLSYLMSSSFKCRSTQLFLCWIFCPKMFGTQKQPWNIKYQEPTQFLKVNRRYKLLNLSNISMYYEVASNL